MKWGVSQVLFLKQQQWLTLLNLTRRKNEDKVPLRVTGGTQLSKLVHTLTTPKFWVLIGATF